MNLERSVGWIQFFLMKWKNKNHVTTRWIRRVKKKVRKNTLTTNWLSIMIHFFGLKGLVLCWWSLYLDELATAFFIIITSKQQTPEKRILLVRLDSTAILLLPPPPAFFFFFFFFIRILFIMKGSRLTLASFCIHLCIHARLCVVVSHLCLGSAVFAAEYQPTTEREREGEDGKVSSAWLHSRNAMGVMVKGGRRGQEPFKYLF